MYATVRRLTCDRRFGTICPVSKKEKISFIESAIMKLIKRDDYLDRLGAVEGTPDIKILSGMRRAGKSKLLEETARRLDDPFHRSSLRT